MTYRRWRYTCGHGKGGDTHAIANCPDCGQPGEFAGWHHDRLTLMGRVWRRTGYPVVTLPYRGGGGWLHKTGRYGLPALMRECPDCAGSGIVDIDNVDAYRVCVTCRGNGAWPLYPPLIMLRYQCQARDLAGLEKAVRQGGNGGGRKP